MALDTLCIVGVGLIGGSIGAAVRTAGLTRHVVGVGRRRDSLRQAVEIGAIDTFTLNLNEGVREADLAIFCTPVDRIAEQILQAASHMKPGAVVTDAGSTKANIVTALEGRLPAEVRFVGSHPLAGSEKRGPEFADAKLFQGRLVVITPTEQTDADAVQFVSEFWSSLGAVVHELDPTTHDRALATTSHLPHLVASALVSLVPMSFRPFCATGFRDTTRVASGDPDLWTAIFRHNREALLGALGRLTDTLHEVAVALEADDVETIQTWLTRAKKVRDSVNPE